jgi:hypothetical protein
MGGDAMSNDPEYYHHVKEGDGKWIFDGNPPL